MPIVLFLIGRPSTAFFELFVCMVYLFWKKYIFGSDWEEKKMQEFMDRTKNNKWEIVYRVQLFSIQKQGSSENLL
jgi:hypothetical protein